MKISYHLHFEKKGENALNTVQKYIIATIFILVTVFIILWMNWCQIKSDSAIQGFLFSFIGAVIGGAISGFGSYLGGSNGAERSYNLITGQEIKNTRMSIIKQIEYSRDLMLRAAIENNGTYFRRLIYDKNWRKQAVSASLSTDDFNLVIDWFVGLEKISEDWSRKSDWTQVNVNESANELVNLNTDICVLLSNLKDSNHYDFLNKIFGKTN